MPNLSDEEFFDADDDSLAYFEDNDIADFVISDDDDEDLIDGIPFPYVPGDPYW